MPFKTQAQATVSTGAIIEKTKVKPLSEEGLNLANLGNNFELAPISQQEQQKRQHDVSVSIQQTNNNTTAILNTPQFKGPSYYGLTKPTTENKNCPKPPTDMTPMDMEICQLVIDKIWNCIWYLGIAHFLTQPTKPEKDGKAVEVFSTTSVTPQMRLEYKINKATMHDYQMCMELYGISDIDAATDLSVLVLFDVIMLIDDSGSMRTTGVSDMTDKPGNTEDYDASEESNNNLSRWDLAKLLSKVGAQVMTMFDDDGISLRFLNSHHKGDNIVDHKNVTTTFEKIGRPTGGTSIGAAIMKLYNEFLRDQLSSCTLDKPVLILTYTDGASSDRIDQAVRNVRSHTRQTPYGSRCVLFSFCQVGNDSSATAMLKNLDVDPDSSNGAGDGAGDITDCTSSYKIEKEEYDKAQKNKNGQEAVPYTEMFHIMKCWLGPIIGKYDKADEM